MTIQQIAETAHKTAVKHGHYKDDAEQAIKDKLEEEVEEFKTALYCNDYKSFPNIDGVSDAGFQVLFELFIKNTVGGELADIIITALAGSVELGIPIEDYIKAVQRNNELRRY